MDARPLTPFERIWSEPKGIDGILRTVNNTYIARRYLITSFLFFLAGGAMALLMRLQLGAPGNTVVDAATYNQLFTMHGTTMMFLFAIPFIEAIANYILPLMLGTRDLPFPRLTAVTYWTFLFGGLFLYSSFLVGAAPDAGWFAYVPLSGPAFSPGLGMDFWDIGLSVAEISAVGAAAELALAVLRTRAPGMSLGRLPLFAWAMLITAVMIVFAFTPLIVATAMLETDRRLDTRFFDAAGGGDPLLWQHLFWVFGHPEVYIMLLPAAGIISQIVQTFSGRPLVAYWPMVVSMLATAVLSFVLWAHHLFATGMSPGAMNVFSGASMLIAIPAGVQVVIWLLTLWSGRPVWRPPLLFAAGGIVIFVLGGLTGVMVAAAPFDMQAHDSHFVVAHLHYVLLGGVVFPLLGGVHYWLPKLTGRLPHEALGRWSFWIMFAGVNVTFLPMHVTGLLGMPRRVYTYEPGLGWESWNLVSTIGSFGIAAGVLLFVGNVVWTAWRAPRSGSDPWNADTLEWLEPSPPPEAQMARIPVVRTRHPLWEESDRLAAPASAPATGLLPETPEGWRGMLIVSSRGAEPRGVVHVPGPTIVPLIVSIGMLLLFVAALVERRWIFLLSLAWIAAGLVMWFRPLRSETIALAEAAGGGGRVAGLPLAVVGPSSNGWWGTVTMLVVLAIALLTIVASVLYLAPRWTTPPAVDGLHWMLAGLVGGGLFMTAIGSWLAASPRWRARSGARRIGLAIAMIMLIAALIALAFLLGYHEIGGAMRIHAYGSSAMFLLVFAGLTALLTLVMLVAAQLWAWRRPEDLRGQAVAANTSLVAWFAAASWPVVAATLYLTPRFLQR